MLLLVILALVACESFEGLEPVTGVEGTLEFANTWPDSLDAAILVVFQNSLALDSVQVEGYALGDHFVTFGNPIDPGATESDYFIQLKPGQYFLVGLGLTTDPATLLLQDDLLTGIDEVIVLPEMPFYRGVIVTEESVNQQLPWALRF